VVALAEFHVSVLDCPEEIFIGEALRDTVGGFDTTFGPYKFVTSAYRFGRQLPLLVLVILSVWLPLLRVKLML
jgi:hypothetical protein